MLLIFAFLFFTYLFSMVFYGSVTLIREKHLLDENQQAAVLKRGRILFIVSIILLLLTGFAGAYLTGPLFILYYLLVLVLNFFGEKRHVRRRAMQRKANKQVE